MNREDVIRLAQEAGFDVEIVGFFNYKPQHIFTGVDADIQRFAALVAAAEREACANILAGKIARHEQFAKDYALRGEYDRVNAIMSTMWKLSECADAIRARGSK